ncbi:uncharacterized protein LOC119532618 [Choloepus didactylus]|uniref:uncharacterized protein LOC119532618 n=1 Tax=Choloepus didactylus TaxID=27675 RepID=UPI00189EF393|nr:uncharacterized protein LOC119532618 [Choloepus didactylus]
MKSVLRNLEGREEGQIPPPPPFLLLWSVSAPALSKDARRRKQRPHRSAPRLGKGGRRPSPLACLPRAAQRHPPEHPRAPSPLFRERLDQQQKARSRLGKRAATAPSHSSCAFSDPAIAQPKTPRSARPASKRPLTRGGSRGGLHRPQSPQLPRVGGAGGVAGWRMLLPTEGRGRNGNRNRRRRLTERSAPLTERGREAARAGQSLTERGRARAGCRARDLEQRQPHSARRGVVAPAAQPPQPTSGCSAVACSAIRGWHLLPHATQRSPISSCECCVSTFARRPHEGLS